MIDRPGAHDPDEEGGILSTERLRKFNGDALEVRRNLFVGIMLFNQGRRASVSLSDFKEQVRDALSKLSDLRIVGLGVCADSNWKEKEAIFDCLEFLLDRGDITMEGNMIYLLRDHKHVEKRTLLLNRAVEGRLLTEREVETVVRSC